MTNEKFIYLTTINVPSHLLFIPKTSFSLFVEVRSQFFHADDGVPRFATEIMNCSIEVISAIDWLRFRDYVVELVEVHWVEMLKQD